MNKVLRATLASAVVITTVIGIASFVLSFAALWDLATMAGVPRSLSWLWPVIVDGTILQATISVIALAQFEDQRSGRRFFWAVLVTAALVSIGANAMHAFISGAGTLHPALSATIATVAPVSLLAATHGLGILVRVPSGTVVTVDQIPDAPTPDAPAPEAVETGAGIEDPREITRPTGPIVETVPDKPSVRPAQRVQPETTDVDPLVDVDRWVLDDDRVEDLYPVDAP
ncbi:excisionase [Rhodococcus sp. 06-156-4C]|nr:MULTISPECIES: DUF2637 domain-containing protein [unclassified Rhodococcus (in: high G+C Gram-positive bacteria)]OZC79250.1 excisionase [Rhodococcus sp. 06-418-1B]OZD15047.1 excisionase [Rhodococcus sp. 06-156-4C]OZF68353.1 excisionase [Rhodococcus sp. 06-156-4]